MEDVATLIAAGRLLEAMAAARVAVAAEPDSVQTLVDLAAACRAVNRPDERAEGRQAAARALQLDPTSLEALRAGIWFQRPYDALRSLEAARAIHPDDAALAIDHAEALARLDRRNDAERLVRRFRDAHPDDVTAQGWLRAVAVTAPARELAAERDAVRVAEATAPIEFGGMLSSALISKRDAGITRPVHSVGSQMATPRSALMTRTEAIICIVLLVVIVTFVLVLALV